MLLATELLASGYHISEKLPEASAGSLKLGGMGSVVLTLGRPFFPYPVSLVLSPMLSVGTLGFPSQTPAQGRVPVDSATSKPSSFPLECVPASEERDGHLSPPPLLPPQNAHTQPASEALA